MKSHTKKRNKFSLAVIILVSLVFAMGGSNIVFTQHNGSPAIAKVTECTQGRRSEVCKGLWFSNGNLQTGILENVSSADLGKEIEVRVIGSRAVKPGLRLPLVLYGLSIAIAFLGWYWWKYESVRSSQN